MRNSFYLRFVAKWRFGLPGPLYKIFLKKSSGKIMNIWFYELIEISKPSDSANSELGIINFHPTLRWIRITWFTWVIRIFLEYFLIQPTVLNLVTWLFHCRTATHWEMSLCLRIKHIRNWKVFWRIFKLCYELWLTAYKVGWKSIIPGFEFAESDGFEISISS